MNKPKVDIGLSVDIIDLCAEDAPQKRCDICQATIEECLINQKNEQERQNDIIEKLNNVNYSLSVGTISDCAITKP